MSEIGQFLKKARKEKNLSIDEIQEVTKIRKRYLEAIENGEYNILPGPFYARAFIKNYAEVLELDAEQIFEEFAHEIPKVSSSAVDTVVPKRKRNMKTASPKVGKWLSRIVLYSFMVFVVFILYLGAVKYFDNLGEQAAENPGITGPTGDGNINADTESSEENEQNQDDYMDDKGENNNQADETIEPTWTRLESDRENTTFEYAGAEKMIIALQANDRVWYSLSDPVENKVLDTEELAKGSEKEWDLTDYEQVILRLGNPLGATLIINGEPVDIADMTKAHNLIINFKPLD